MHFLQATEILQRGLHIYCLCALKAASVTSVTDEAPSFAMGKANGFQECLSAFCLLTQIKEFLGWEK